MDGNLMRVIVAMPIYEDWESALKLCGKIDLVFRDEPSTQVTLLFIDDGSSGDIRTRDFPLQLQAIEKVAVLFLRRNLGHQRAIAVGLAYLQQQCQGDTVVVMDADGQDRPEDIPRLLDAMKRSDHPVAV